MTMTTFRLTLTSSQRMALLDILSAAIAPPAGGARIEVYVDVVAGVETRPEELLDLVLNCPPPTASTADMTPADQTLAAAIVGAETPQEQAWRIHAFYRDIDRANRAPRELLYFHMGLLHGGLERVLASKHP